MISQRGSLVVMGSGIRGLHQMTNEARGRLNSAERVFYAVCDPFSESLIKRTCETAIDLCEFYEEGKDRRDTYREMIEAILNQVRAGFRVCALFYGHPGVFVYPSFECVRIAHEEGYRASMLPGISAEDCLYADLGVDPGAHGCISYEATDFLLSDHTIDPSCSVILWQVDCVGDRAYHENGYDGRFVPLLVDALMRFYQPDHMGYLYTAPILSVGRARVNEVRLGCLHEQLPANPSFGTLFIPPANRPNVDLAMAERLGIAIAELESYQQSHDYLLKFGDAQEHVYGQGQRFIKVD
ncbi:SAM-dependent methyltransferase [Nocardia sp. R7R-8]|uniref:SAM-dependent methyltransferase n=1 Tax=Nocardia sp. R7R-8 TaxID=3459304 RepID=UPI00403E1CFE